MARHTGRNPHIAGPLDPNAAIVADRDKLRARAAELKDKLAAAIDRAMIAEQRNRELTDQFDTVRLRLEAITNKPYKASRRRVKRRKPQTKRPETWGNKTKPARKVYMRELMRRKRAQKSDPDPAVTSIAPIAVTMPATMPAAT